MWAPQKQQKGGSISVIFQNTGIFQISFLVLGQRENCFDTACLWVG